MTDHARVDTTLGRDPVPGSDGARSYAGARVTVVGLGREGVAVARVLAAEGARVTVSDRRDAAALGAELALLDCPTLSAPHPVRLVLGTDAQDGPRARETLDGCDTLVLSPGVDRRSPLVREARARGIPLSSETALFFARCRAPIIGVTGSAGKTTTTTLIGEMLRRGPRPVFVGGNIGRPLLECLPEIGPDAWVVLELSSFQLDDLGYSPAVAVVTNITPNHLDRHETMAAYAAAKATIVVHQRPGDLAVLNFDDAATAALTSRTAARVLYFSLTSPVPDGAFLTAHTGDPWLTLTYGGVSTPLCSSARLHVPGQHNVANALAAAAVAAACGIAPLDIEHSITAFRGVPHRLQSVGVYKDVSYYDDSIATAPERTLAALAATTAPLVLILGGRDKHLPWAGLARAAARRCRAVVLIGEAAELIRGHLETAIAYEMAQGSEGDDDGRQAQEPAGAGDGDRLLLRPAAIVGAGDMVAAVERAAALAQPGDAVLLSPGCTSYDMYRDFAERGDLFARAVAEVAGGPAGNG